MREAGDRNLDEMAERHARGLGELGQMGLDLARKLHAAAMDAEAIEDAERLALAFHALSRSVRQSFALEAKLQRDRRKALVDEARAADQARTAAVARRRTQVDATLNRLIWTEGERPDRLELLVRAGDLLDHAAVCDDFLDGDADDVVLHILRILRLTPEAARIRRPDPPSGEGPDPAQPDPAPPDPAPPDAVSPGLVP